MFLGYMFPQDAPPIVKLPFCYILPIFYVSILVLNITNGVAVFFAYGAFVVPFMIKELRLDHPPYKSISTLREPDTLMLAYRTSQVLHGKALSVVSFFLLPTQTIVYKMVIFTSYMMLKYGQEMDRTSIAKLIGWTALSGLFWGAVLVMGGNLHYHGNNVLLSWRYHNQWKDKFQKKIMNKFRKSCKPFQMNYGKTYVIKRLTVLKFMRSLSRGILKALLAL